MVTRLSALEHQSITDAIRAAERNTCGEIYVVVAQTPDRTYSLAGIGMALALAAVFSLLVPWPLHVLTDLSPLTILLIQAATFVTVSLLTSHPVLTPLVLPKAFAAAASRRAAEELFLAHGVHLTEARTGILIYVAAHSRRVEIVADDSIDRKVAQSVWNDLASNLAIAARCDQVAKGLVEAVVAAGKLLEEHFPPALNDRNELSDRVVEI